MAKVNDYRLVKEDQRMFSPTLAKIIGMKESIILQQVHFSTEKKREKGPHNNHSYQDGYYWVFDSIKDWQEKAFPFLSVDTVKRAFNKLINEGLLITGSYNRSGIDRTKWYRVNYEELERKFQSRLVQNAPIDEGKMHYPDEGKMHQAIPNTSLPNTSANITPMHIPQESGNGAAVPFSDYVAANYNGSTKCGKEDLNKADKVPVSAAPDYEKLFNELWLLYPRRMGLGMVTMDLKKEIYSVGRDQMIRCIDRFKDDMKRQERPDDKIPYGSTFFNGGYIDYLDENYAEKPTRKPHKITV